MPDYTPSERAWAADVDRMATSLTQHAAALGQGQEATAIKVVTALGVAAMRLAVAHDHTPSEAAALLRTVVRQWEQEHGAIPRLRVAGGRDVDGVPV